MPGSHLMTSLTDLPALLRASKGFDTVIAALKKGQAGTIDGAWGSSAALAAAALAEVNPGPTLIVLAHPTDLDNWSDDLESFLGRRPMQVPDRDEPGQRLRVLKSLLSPRGINSEGQHTIAPDPLTPSPSPSRGEGSQKDSALRTQHSGLFLTSITAMMQPVPSPAALAEQSRELIKDDEVRLETLITWLVEGGYTRSEVVELPGEFSRRGGILDVYPADADSPVRLEFFGDVIDSIRRFAPETQRSQEPVDRISVTVFTQKGLSDTVPFTKYLPDTAIVLLVEPADLREQAKVFLERVEDIKGLFGIDATFRHLIKLPSVHITALPTVSAEATCHLQIESVERFSGEAAKVAEELATLSGQVIIACPSTGEQQRLGELLAGVASGGRQPPESEKKTPSPKTRRKATAPSEVTTPQPVHSGGLRPPLATQPILLMGHVKAGFRLVAQQITIIGAQELFRREATPTSRRISIRKYETRAIESFLDLAEGDLVVHVNHGIARYKGLQVLDTKGQLSEHMLLEFGGGTKLYVPTDKIDLVQKYVGGGKSDPELSKLGGSSWARRKEKVREAVLDLAAEMVDLQAQRATLPGFSYPADTKWMNEFETAFPYEETPDQATAITEVKKDLEHPHPMDRLLCGDVGYGKTEVALRAAFKAVDGGKQVAILVPTTVLAEQHYRTFSTRLAAFPFKVACLSRFRRPSEAKELVKQLNAGELDIAIGTHRLLSKDVAFKDLGLVIIDEEQRFGVEHKEKLKKLRSQVHVLTMTATPIPRTLHMSLLGIRDISNLETPPQGRMPIETRICRFDPELVKHAINRELAREGQIYFVHNRVYDIEAVAHRLQQIVPQARIVIGHGQMNERELEDVMIRFVKHEADILLATTIIESGLDIPNTNTIFIDEAENYGLADLHQLRGRVGRYKHRAYCYLLLDPNKKLSDIAAKRLKAIEEFRELGAGFKIALRDLEIRGAGNILGAEQSGHIASVGYELYCQLLDEAVRRAKKQPVRQMVEVTIELPWPAFLPASYVEGQKAKIEVYRRLGRVKSLDRLADFQEELDERYGALPEPVINLIKMHELRLLAVKHSVYLIRLEGKDLVLEYRQRNKIDKLANNSGPVPAIPGLPPITGNRLRVVDDQAAYYRLYLDNEKTPEGMYGCMRALFTGENGAA
ncbi:MAG TPA: transcription-repair coupling factor [Gemmatales bacterium]|nr:transcription-repair coupling factor [Gemmatales bacterium]